MTRAERLTPAIGHWWTVEEWGYDHRTGASAYLKERLRRPRDRVGKEKTVWNWIVVCDGERTEGHAQKQVGARAAVRKIIRALPDRKGA